MAHVPRPANTAAWPAAMFCLGASTEMPPPGSFCRREGCVLEERCRADRTQAGCGSHCNALAVHWPFAGNTMAHAGSTLPHSRQYHTNSNPISDSRRSSVASSLNSVLQTSACSWVRQKRQGLVAERACAFCKNRARRIVPGLPSLNVSWWARLHSARCWTPPAHQRCASSCFA